MFSYIAYGLGITSDMPLPELSVGVRATDVTIRLGNFTHPFLSPDSLEVYSRVTPEEVIFRWSGEGSILVRGGNEIIVDLEPGVDERVVRLSILGPALATLLHQRGDLTLHASAVNVYGGAVAFLGESGWGKSTIAAALHAHGYGIVVDDILAVQLRAHRAMISPGFPQLKLWPETIILLGNDPKALPLIQPGREKRACRVDQDFAHASIPLKQIYILTEDNQQGIERLQPQDAFVELVRHTYTGGLLAATRTIERHFHQCIQLANFVPVYRLKRSLSTSNIENVVRMVDEHLSSQLNQHVS